MQNDLNDIFRKSGETNYTPPAVIGTLIENQAGGQVTVINPPYEASRSKRHRWWKKTLRIWHFYLTFSNCRVKKRIGCHDFRTENLASNMRGIKGKHYKKQKGCCPICGKHYEMNQMELHHVLPWARFPELRAMERNMMFVCRSCHKEIHNDHWLNIRLMKEKAKELGIDLKDKYRNYADEECNPTD